MNEFAQLLQNIPVVKPIAANRWIAIDLSADAYAKLNLQQNDADALEKYIAHYITQNQADAAWGGYLEKRSLYHTHELFSNQQNPRNIHLGLDLWAAAGTPVYAAVSGRIHSFANNASSGNYGPTIILEHEHPGLT